MAEGPSYDSLRITLLFIVDGRERWREKWTSAWFRVEPFPDSMSQTARAAAIRARLEATLSSVTVEPFDVNAYKGMAGMADSALLHHPPAEQIGFEYGYESHVVLRWDAAAGVFRRLWGCC